ncbi:helix-turn-helix transcriptional regulator [Halopseudomonas pelagia]|uniref:helix-turn-helix transcriptional regulator n=1 Tax=Halopseudomonas pelagia TaxID=553151 RepID=UPI00278C8E69|nr:AlpA family phage regulatory protein [Halopseudomonas pelagia]
MAIQNLRDSAPTVNCWRVAMTTKHKRLLRLKDVVSRTGLSSSSLYNRMNERSVYFDASFPQRIKLGATTSRLGAVAWDADELDAWIESRKSQRGGGM